MSGPVDSAARSSSPGPGGAPAGSPGRLHAGPDGDGSDAYTGLRVFSYGGGVQSTAALVLAAQGAIDYPVFLFANVGEDSEHPDTLAYVDEVARPYAAEHGIELASVRLRRRNGSEPTLLEELHRCKRSVVIPARMDNGAPGNRTCTFDFKIRTIERELKRRGATREAPATIGLGISLDEIQRAKTPFDPRSPCQLRAYPLLDLGLARQDCRNIIERSGLPMPGRSACFFCPFHTREEWNRLARKRPDLFAKAVEVEQLVNERGHELGRGDFWLSTAAKPLDKAFNGDQTVLFDDEDDSCESGYCMT